MKLAIGADHRGYNLKELLKQHFPAIEWVDCGTDQKDTPSDFPVFAQKVCQSMLADNGCYAGILICGSGIGMSIAANRYKGIFAGLCWSAEVAEVAKKDDCINVLVLPADFVSEDEVVKIVQTWQEGHCLLDHHADRRAMIDERLPK